ncbi:polyprenyl synthetase family protein [Crocinitomicaceae bacterium]|jgi:geranylgeranyl diphosphate synthase type II|nr:polyprenyl synthetase family protein [Crocinitomicaceae bacterium]MDG2464906.1 polyprenyl synthetase family protein [Crocinitomicaceae bacterium]
MTEKIIALSKLVEQGIHQFELPIKPNNLYDPLRYFMTLGGKRIRPVLSLMGAKLFNAPAENVLHVSIGVELFHNFTLIHDDIMDAAPLRRAKETVHSKWNENIAILSGDVLMVKAYEEICKQKPEDLPELLTLFNRTAIEVCEGQQMDMDFEERDDVSITEYIEMIRLKTSVLLGCSLEMGAIVAKANKADREKLYSFGQELGIAFQIKDDILDLYGDPKKFGKQIGGDVMANKKTLLYLLAREAANKDQMDQFDALEKDIDSTRKVATVRALFDELGVQEKAKSTMELHRKNAMKSLNEINVPEEQKTDLRELADYLMNREN